MPIQDRADLKMYLAEDLRANGVARWRFALRFRRPELHYQRLLRRVEYCQASPGPVFRVLRFYLRFRLMQLSVRTGISIPPGVFGPGLSIAHYGSIVVHTKARVGAYCRINSATNIGMTPDGVPTLGDYVYIAPGAVIYGDITIGDRVVIGANAVVGRDVESGVTVAGSPARVISRRDSGSIMPEFVPVPRNTAAGLDRATEVDSRDG
jgi:serine O-acetyltransferase